MNVYNQLKLRDGSIKGPQRLDDQLIFKDEPGNVITDESLKDLPEFVQSKTSSKKPQLVHKKDGSMTS